MKAYSVVIPLLLQVLIYLSASFVFCKHALLMFQQNRYELYRYSKWLFNRRNIYFNPSYVYAALVIIVSLIFKNNLRSGIDGSCQKTDCRLFYSDVLIYALFRDRLSAFCQRHLEHHRALSDDLSDGDHYFADGKHDQEAL